MADILVVDDIYDVAEPLITFLEIIGHHVRYADDGTTGIEEVNRRFPELIFLDIEMPKLKGPEMAYRLLVEDAGREKIPIIVISGAANLAEVVAQIGTPYFIGKPYHLNEIDSLLKLALKERKPPHPCQAPGGKSSE